MDNCCLNMYVSGTMGVRIPVFEWTSPITGAYPSFSFEVDGDTLSLVFNEETSEWQIFAGDVFVGSSTYEGNNECPSGLNIVNEGDITYSATPGQPLVVLSGPTDDDTAAPPFSPFCVRCVV